MDRVTTRDATATSRERTPSRAWWLVAGLLITAFLARGPLYLSVFPPFEGWDEYQHLAYIAHLDETGTIPVFDESRVSLALRPLVIAMPHSPWGGEQVQEWGALSYADYWNAPARARRHGSRSVVLTATVSSAASAARLRAGLAHLARVEDGTSAGGDLRDPDDEPASRRGCARAVCRRPRSAWCRHSRPGWRSSRWCACIRCSFRTSRAWRTMRSRLPPAWRGSVCWCSPTGVRCSPVACWRPCVSRRASGANKPASTLIPALVLGLPLIGWVHGVSAGRLWRVTSIVGVAFLLLVAPLWLWSYQHYGAIVTTQESLELAARGSDRGRAGDLVHEPWPGGRLSKRSSFPEGPGSADGAFCRCTRRSPSLYGWYWGILLAAAGVGAVRRDAPPRDGRSNPRRPFSARTAGPRAD